VKALIGLIERHGLARERQAGGGGLAEPGAEAQAGVAERDAEHAGHEAGDDLQTIALPKEMHEERQDRRDNETGDRGEMRRMHGGRPGTHSGNHQSDEKLMRLVTRADEKNAASPQHAGRQRAGHRQPRPILVLFPVARLASVQVPGAQTGSGQCEDQSDPTQHCAGGAAVGQDEPEQAGIDHTDRQRDRQLCVGGSDLLRVNGVVGSARQHALPLCTEIITQSAPDRTIVSVSSVTTCCRYGQQTVSCSC
jgi:hypothetical protein